MLGRADGSAEPADQHPERDPEATSCRRAELEPLVHALASMPLRLRSVLVLRDVYDLPHEAIASELGISKGAAKVRLHRAREQLRARLDAQGAGTAQAGEIAHDVS